MRKYFGELETGDVISIAGVNATVDKLIDIVGTGIANDTDHIYTFLINGGSSSFSVMITMPSDLIITYTR